MLVAFIGAASVVIAAVITGVWTVIAESTDHARAQQEADILSKLDTNSDAARWLREIIDSRVGRWHRRIFRPKQGQVHAVYGATVARSMEPKPAVVAPPSWIIVLVFAVGAVALIVIGILAAATR
ncbi:hypothetical protein GCM10011575_17680 [Microlunatus endophyticus]|uniref:Uncharacterized protein n=1 Tax=Microlunatus endophyticus TaxID=1716077 RepID=A0A917S5G8_9ACTN|nr:hypothetical protein [Microlunatus endophyticus]GGL59567.1 hypothetical protein GCM10011575_17680 [Microlunatus endophyticus]